MRLTDNTLSILGCVCVAASTYYIYKKAKRNRRSGIKWAFINLTLGFVFQFILPLLIATMVAFSLIISNGTTKDVDRIYAKYGLISNITILTLNFVGIWLVLRQASKTPQSENCDVPPPPTFDGK